MGCRQMSDQIDRHLERLELLLDENRLGECVELAFRITQDKANLSAYQWYRVGTALARATVRLGDSPDARVAGILAMEALQAAVAIPTELISEVERGLAFRSIGVLYSQDLFAIGDPTSNRDLAIHSFRMAAEKLVSPTTRREWAEVMQGLGCELLSRARALSGDEIEKWGEKVDQARESVRESIAVFEAALEYFVEADFPEEHSETVGLIDGAHHVLDVLNRTEREVQ